MKKLTSILLATALIFISTKSITSSYASTYPSSLGIISSNASNDSIQLSFSEVNLSNGDEYHMGCAENNVDLGIDAPSYTTIGFSSPLKIQNLKSDTEYSCNILIKTNGDSYVSPSKELRLKTAESLIYQEKDKSEMITPVPAADYEDKVITNHKKNSNPFPDTNINILEGKAAAELYRRAIIGGFPDGEFKGSKNVNRAEAAKFLLLARGTGAKELKNKGRFWDVKEGEWYVKYIMTAAQKGIISGYPDSSFKPAKRVNTAEFLKMLTLSFNLEKNLSHLYTDVESDDWFAQYAGIAKKYNLFPKRNESLLQPSRKLSRNEVAVAIYQYLENK